MKKQFSLSELKSGKKLIIQNKKFYVTDNDIIKKGDKILYKIGGHINYPCMFGECLGFDKNGFILIHDDMSVQKDMCIKLIEIQFVSTMKCS